VPGIEISLIVEAVDGAGDRAHVAFPLALVRDRRGRLRRRFGGPGDVDVLGGLARGVLATLFGEIFRVRTAGEGDPLSVRRPHRRRSAARVVGEAPGLAAGKREDVYLRRLRLAIAERRAEERDAPPVRRPARLRVARSRGQARGRRAAVGRHDPDGGVVAVPLLVDGDAGERHARPVRRRPRIGDPDEAEEIRFGEEALRRLLCERRVREVEEKEERSDEAGGAHAAFLTTGFG
jgi:hypothetical protein